MIVYQPVFHDGKLFAWTSAIAHQPDLGGVGLGSFSPAAQDVFSESLPTPPVKVVRDGQLQRDVADLWVRRSRVPMLIGLDLRAKIGANNVGRERMHALIDQYGADTVKAVMKRMMGDAESRLRGKLASLPDGSWSATGYQDQSHEGDRGLHKITVTTTKTGDHLTFDFTGTDPQAGVINCTYAGHARRRDARAAAHPGGRHPLVGGRADALLRPVTEEGTLNNATFPAAVSRGPIGPAWLTGSLVAECLSQMLDRSLELGKNVQATCCGTWDTAVIAGLDERGEQPAPFLNIIMEPMAGGYGARPHADGIDTGGLFCIPMGRIPDVEMTEFLYPVLTLWRREEPDSGGPGRHRGGVGASVAITPHGTSVPMGLILASAGKAVAQNAGLSRRPPRQHRPRRHRPAEPGRRAARRRPRCPPSWRRSATRSNPARTTPPATWPRARCSTMTWQGGGGYGDPLGRDPDAVARDVREQKVTAGAALASTASSSSTTRSTRTRPRPSATGGALPAATAPPWTAAAPSAT